MVALLRLFMPAFRSRICGRNSPETLFELVRGRPTAADHSGWMRPGPSTVQSKGGRARWRVAGFWLGLCQGLYCAVCVCGIAVQERPQYLRGPQQRSLVQLRLSVRRLTSKLSQSDDPN